jgi:hypothetical protein
LHSTGSEEAYQEASAWTEAEADATAQLRARAKDDACTGAASWTAVLTEMHP